MKCPNCGSENVTISLEETGTKTKKSGVGFGGHMNNMARGMTARRISVVAYTLLLPSMVRRER